MRRAQRRQRLEVQLIRADREALARLDALLHLDAEKRRPHDADERHDHADVDDVSAGRRRSKHGRRSRHTPRPWRPSCASPGENSEILKRALGSAATSASMVGCAALQAGHCRSPNSTMVTGASGAAPGAGDALLEPFFRGIKRLGAERNNFAEQGVLAIGRDVEAALLLALRAGENDGDLGQFRDGRRLDAGDFPGQIRLVAKRLMQKGINRGFRGKAARRRALPWLRWGGLFGRGGLGRRGLGRDQSAGQNKQTNRVQKLTHGSFHVQS